MPDTAAARTAGWSARSVGELAAAHAAKADLDRRPRPEVTDAIRAAGFARHFVPARFGGAEGSFTDFTRAVAEVAEGDASAAWCASIAATLGRMAAFLPEQGQRTVWADGPDAQVVGALMPGGTAEAVDGGWLVSGKWAYLSGIHGSQFALLCCPVPTADGGREVRFLLVPRAAYTVEETWFTVGMRGTGSDTLALAPTFVPVEHSFAREDLLVGRAQASAAHCHNVPLKSVSGLSFAAPVLGAATGALRSWAAAQAAKRAAVPAGPRISGGTDASAELTLARAAGELDAARLLLERAAADADLGRPEPALAARAQRDHAFAVDLLLDSVNRLARSAGTRAQSEAEDFQRYWRDANAAAGHVVLQWEPAARGWAEQRLAGV
ncbi:acyl-CoA dehydrogenase family protein [Kitasatospora sp. NPDC058965]|uniref:acyl-CoA dehydrogenase family protein n=1 Tax=Kitasatospora sp. NPDC058965 TaxID=3346682 RepID=UPI0036A57909